MADLRLLANMNISPKTVNALKEKGIDIIRVSDLLPVTSSDREILDLARRDNRTVVTQDLDFSSLLTLGGFNRPSLITLRMTVSDPVLICRRGGKGHSLRLLVLELGQDLLDQLPVFQADGN